MDKLNKTESKSVIIDELHEIDSGMVFQELRFTKNDAAIMVTKTTSGTVLNATEHTTTAVTQRTE